MKKPKTPGRPKIDEKNKRKTIVATVSAESYKYLRRKENGPVGQTIDRLLKLTGALGLLLTLQSCGAEPKSPQGDAETIKIVESVANSVWHGSTDNALSFQEKLGRYNRGEKLTLTCGRISGLAFYLLTQRGLYARLVGSLTLEEWNGFDDGHTLLEVYSTTFKKWIVYDLDMNQQPLVNGKPLTLPEFRDATQNGTVEFAKLATDPLLDPNDVNYETFKSYDWSAWYKRVLQITLVYTNGKWVYPSHAEDDRITAHFSYEPTDNFDALYK